jgi:prevent-host-death family protein
MAKKLEKINLSEAKAHLGKYVKQAKKGKVFVICERNEPAAELLGIPEPKNPPLIESSGFFIDEFRVSSVFYLNKLPAIHKDH